MPLRILLVEDNRDDALLVEQAFADAGSMADILRVSRLSDAQQVVKDRAFDWIVLDLGLLDSTGLDALRRAKWFSNGTPVICHTGQNDVRLAQECRDWGAALVLLKSTPCGLPMAIASLSGCSDEEELEADAALARLAEPMLA